MAMRSHDDAGGDDVWEDVLPVLVEELRCLPDKYREPIVLCDLEGKSLKEAACQLDWAEGTVAGRLARGRVRLAQRLRRRGMTLAAGSLPIMVWQIAVAASLPASLVRTTMETANASLVGQSGLGVLAASVLRDMSRARFKASLVLVGAIVGVIEMVAGLSYAVGERGPARPGGKAIDGAQALKKTAGDASKLVPVWSVAFSPDGKQIASGGFDGAVRIWNLVGKVTHVWKGHQQQITSVAWSPDGTRLASASLDGTVRIWKRDGTTGPILKGHTGVVASVAWSADGKYLASAGFADHTVRIWHADGRAGAVLQGHTQRVHSVAWHPKFHAVASGNYDGTVRMWTVDGRQYRWLKGGGGHILGVAWGQGGVLLSSANRDGTISLWDVGYAEIGDDSEPGKRTKAHKSHVLSLSWSPNGMKLVSSGADKMVRIWNAALKSKFILRGHDIPSRHHLRFSHYVHSVSWGPDEKHIVSGGMDGTFRLWNAKTGKVVWVRNAGESVQQKTNGKKSQPAQGNDKTPAANKPAPSAQASTLRTLPHKPSRTSKARARTYASNSA